MKLVTHHRGASAVAALVLASLASCTPARTPAATAPSPTGYPDSVAVAPLYLRVASPAAPIGRSAPERRRLAGRGAEFMRGVGHVPGALPVRGSVWWGDAAPLAVGGDSVAFATPWVPVSRLDGSLTCPSPATGNEVGVRLLAVVRDSSGDLAVEAWIDNAGGGECEGSRDARDRLRAFTDDVEMFARNVARLGVPVPAG
jgi:hypothetical protein